MRAMKRTISIAAVALALGVTATANADEPKPFGARGPLVIAVDNLFGVTRATSGSSGLTQIGAPLPSGDRIGATRLGFHGFIAGTVSLGVGLHWWTVSSAGARSLTAVGAYPRVGFALPIDPRNAFWFRAGVGYLQVSRGDDRASSWFVGGEISYVYTPVRHFGVMVGPMIDIGVGPRALSSNGTTIETRTASVYGVTLGILFDL